MKRNVLLITMIFAIFATSCSLFKSATQKAEAKLIGKWSIVDIEMPGNEKEIADSKDIIKKMLEGAYMQFNADKTLEAFLGSKTEGTWELADEGKSLKTTMNSKSETIKIDLLTATDLKLVIESKSGDGGVLIMKKITK